MKAKERVINGRTKVSTVLDQALECRTAQQASTLRDRLLGAFRAQPQLSHLDYANPEAYIESDHEGPFVRFELNRVLSGDYITMIRPEIRNGAVAVVVITNRMLDGAGMACCAGKQGVCDQSQAAPPSSTDPAHRALEKNRPRKLPSRSDGIDQVYSPGALGAGLRIGL